MTSIPPSSITTGDLQRQSSGLLPSTISVNSRKSENAKWRKWIPKLSRKEISALASVLALTGSLMIYGVLQERIMTVPFGNEGRRFRHSLFLVFCNRIVAWLIALLTIWCSGGALEPVAPIQSYGFISIANVISSACQYEALKYVSFPVQVLAKCTKMLPVMIWQMVITRKWYTLREYLEASVVALGCAIFLLTGEVTSAGMPGSESTKAAVFVGGGILAMYLAMDGFTSTWQDVLFTGYNMDIGNQVLYTTMCSLFISITGLVVSGALQPALRFVWTYPEVWFWIVGISLASATVQFLVTHTIKEYGALVFATVMTTRQWFSILLSCFIFAHPLSAGQWLLLRFWMKC